MSRKMRGFWPLFLTAACLFASAPVAQAQGSGMGGGMASKSMEAWQQHLFQGNELARSKKYMAALRHYDQALQDNPNAWEVYLHKAKVYELLGMPDHVIANYDLAMQMSPRQADPYLQRAEYFMRFNSPAQALYDLEEGLRVLPYNPDLHFARGEFYRKQKKYSQALQDFGMAVRVRPGMVQAYDKMARCYYVQENWMGYEQALSGMLQYGRAAADIYFSRAWVRLQLNNGGGAKSDLDAGLTLAPNTPIALFQRGKIFLAQEQCGPALADFKQACKLGLTEACFKKPPCTVPKPVVPKPPENTGDAVGVSANSGPTGEVPPESASANPATSAPAGAQAAPAEALPEATPAGAGANP